MVVSKPRLALLGLLAAHCPIALVSTALDDYVSAPDEHFN
eukprot:SAG31_NODE_17124_length_682_cov_1.102916_1_plen_39_part_10